MGVLIFILSAALNVVLITVPATIVLAPMAGQLYGLFWGTVALVIGETLGAALCFLSFRVLQKRIIEAVVTKIFGRRIVYPKKQPEENLIWPMIIARQLFFPLELLSISLSFTNISLVKFLIIITLANIPIDTIYVCVGTAKPESIIFGVVAAIVLGLVWMILRRTHNHHLESIKQALPRFEKLADQKT